MRHFTGKLIRLIKSYAKEPFLAFLKAMLVCFYREHKRKMLICSPPSRYNPSIFLIFHTLLAIITHALVKITSSKFQAVLLVLRRP